MAIKIPAEARKQAVASIERYFQTHMDGEIGSLAADALLEFFLAEIGPLAYNAAVADLQQHLQTRIMEADVEVYEEPFRFWDKSGAKIRRK